MRCIRRLKDLSPCSVENGRFRGDMIEKFRRQRVESADTFMLKVENKTRSTGGRNFQVCLRTNVCLKLSYNSVVGVVTERSSDAVCAESINVFKVAMNKAKIAPSLGS